ncbi:MAG: amidohydrolase family protein [Bacteroidia bacterium]|nr:amidohydrolase family protein [Bacteroidia bacterium]
MILDAHQHFWRYDPLRHSWISDEMALLRRDFLPQDLAPIYEASEVAGCIAVQADQTEAETAFLLDLASEHPWIRGVVGWADLCSPRIEARLEYWAEDRRLCGFRHIVQSEPDPAFMQRPDFCRGIAALGGFGFAYDILIYPHQLESAIRLADQFPDQRFVLDHLAKPRLRGGVLEPWAAQLRELAQRPNVCCKLSGLVTEAAWTGWSYDTLAPALDHAAEAFGARRLIYGSDWPVCLLAAEYQHVLGIVQQQIAQWSASEQEQVLYRNALHWYQLPHRPA